MAQSDPKLHIVTDLSPARTAVKRARAALEDANRELAVLEDQLRARDEQIAALYGIQLEVHRGE